MFFFFRKTQWVFEVNNINAFNQFGFKKNGSTGDDLLFSLENIVEELDRNNKPVELFCDLIKAFDCVDHNLLIKKLEMYDVLDWCGLI